MDHSHDEAVTRLHSKSTSELDSVRALVAEEAKRLHEGLSEEEPTIGSDANWLGHYSSLQGTINLFAARYFALADTVARQMHEDGECGCSHEQPTEEIPAIAPREVTDADIATLFNGETGEERPSA